jgi:ATP synthase I chain
MSDELGFDRAACRIARNMVWIGALATVSVFLAAGWKWGGGFLLGAIAAWFNFRWLKRLVEALGGGRRPGSAWLASRYLLLAAGCYVILRFSPISAPAVVTGMFILIAAIFVEILFELVYARKRTLDHQDL